MNTDASDKVLKRSRTYAISHFDEICVNENQIEHGFEYVRFQQTNCASNELLTEFILAIVGLQIARIDKR